jgi:hypothetical protein
MQIKLNVNLHLSSVRLAPCRVAAERYPRSGEIVISMIFMRLLFLIAICLLFPRQTVGQGKDSASAIKEIHKLVEVIDENIKQNRWTNNRKSVAYSEPYVPTDKSLILDDTGIVRKYSYSAGSDDSHLLFDFYYDSVGLLRFVFIIGGAVNGSHLEHKIYFDSLGKRIGESHQYTKGPGYTFPTVWPDDDLVFNPKKDYDKTKE